MIVENLNRTDAKRIVAPLIAVYPERPLRRLIQNMVLIGKPENKLGMLLRNAAEHRLCDVKGMD